MKDKKENVLNGIFNISCLVPAVGFLLLGLILWFWYPLHKKQVDANVAALGEMLYHNEYNSACMVTLGTGVGAGIVVDGKLIQGSHGNGGEDRHQHVPRRGHCLRQ